MDIGSNNKGPARDLSNFTYREFWFDGIPCFSLEGVLQAFKFENVNSQEITCALVGFRAKKKGKKRNKYWQNKQSLWWKGKECKRDSKEYQLLLNRLYNAVYQQDESFRNALAKTNEATLTHSIGHNKASSTVLTTTEFVSRLTHLRDVGLLPEE